MKYGIKNLIFLGLIILSFCFIFASNFVRYYVNKDYTLNVFVTCNPTEKSCFEVNEETEADIMFQSKPYAKVTIASSEAPKCLDEHNCQQFSCDGFKQCEITYCSTDLLEYGERCTESSY